MPVNRGEENTGLKDEMLPKVFLHFVQGSPIFIEEVHEKIQAAIEE